MQYCYENISLFDNYFCYPHLFSNIAKLRLNVRGVRIFKNMIALHDTKSTITIFNLYSVIWAYTHLQNIIKYSETTKYVFEIEHNDCNKRNLCNKLYCSISLTLDLTIGF